MGMGSLITTQAPFPPPAPPPKVLWGWWALARLVCTLGTLTAPMSEAPASPQFGHHPTGDVFLPAPQRQAQVRAGGSPWEHSNVPTLFSLLL